MVKAGLQVLGKVPFKESIGRFGEIKAAHPYMEALFELGLTLESQRTEEAIAHYRQLLRLDQNDNMGAHYRLSNAPKNSVFQGGDVRRDRKAVR